MSNFGSRYELFHTVGNIVNFEKKSEKYFFTTYSLKNIFFKLKENNGSRKKFSIKTVNLCQSAKPFSVHFNCLDPYSEYGTGSGSTKLLNTVRIKFGSKSITLVKKDHFIFKKQDCIFYRIR